MSGGRRAAPGNSRAQRKKWQLHGDPIGLLVDIRPYIPGTLLLTLQPKRKHTVTGTRRASGPRHTHAHTQCQASLPTQWMSLCLQESSSCRKPRLSIVHCCLLHRLAIFYRPLPWARTYCWVLPCAHVTGGFYSRAGWRAIWGGRGCSIPLSIALICPTHQKRPLPSLPASLCARVCCWHWPFNEMCGVAYSTWRLRSKFAIAYSDVCQRVCVKCALFQSTDVRHVQLPRYTGNGVITGKKRSYLGKNKLIQYYFLKASISALVGRDRKVPVRNFQAIQRQVKHWGYTLNVHRIQLINSLL